MDNRLLLDAGPTERLCLSWLNQLGLSTRCLPLWSTLSLLPSAWTIFQHARYREPVLLRYQLLGANLHPCASRKMQNLALERDLNADSWWLARGKDLSGLLPCV